MSRLIVLGVALAMLAAGAITLALLKVPKPAAAHHAAVPFDTLHSFLQRGRDEMALP